MIANSPSLSFTGPLAAIAFPPQNGYPASLPFSIPPRGMGDVPAAGPPEVERKKGFYRVELEVLLYTHFPSSSFTPYIFLFSKGAVFILLCYLQKRLSWHQ